MALFPRSRQNSGKRTTRDSATRAGRTPAGFFRSSFLHDAHRARCRFDRGKHVHAIRGAQRVPEAGGSRVEGYLRVAQSVGEVPRVLELRSRPWSTAPRAAQGGFGETTSRENSNAVGGVQDGHARGRELANFARESRELIGRTCGVDVRVRGIVTRHVGRGAAAHPRARKMFAPEKQGLDFFRGARVLSRS